MCEEVAVRETPHRRLCASRICTCALRGVQSVDLQRRVCTHARRTSIDGRGLLLLPGGASLLLHWTRGRVSAPGAEKHPARCLSQKVEVLQHAA